MVLMDIRRKCSAATLKAAGVRQACTGIGGLSRVAIILPAAHKPRLTYHGFTTVK
jgi:hypothetical protein